MNKFDFRRIVLAGLFVLLPIILLLYYEAALRKRMDLPSLVSLVTAPLIKPEEKRDEKTEETKVQHQESPQYTKIASTEKAEKAPPLPEEQPSADKEKPAFAPSSVSIPLAKEEATQEPEPQSIDRTVSETPAKAKALHAGPAQDGLLVPNLLLDMEENVLLYLLREKQAYLLATIEGQHYLLTITEAENPFRNVEVGYLQKHGELSERYLPLSRSHLKTSDISALDRLIIEKVGRSSEPGYNLVFSRQYDEYLTRVQLAEAEKRDLDLPGLCFDHTPVQMRGKLVRKDKRIELHILDVMVGEKS